MQPVMRQLARPCFVRKVMKGSLMEEEGLKTEVLRMEYRGNEL